MPPKKPVASNTKPAVKTTTIAKPPAKTTTTKPVAKTTTTKPPAPTNGPAKKEEVAAPVVNQNLAIKQLAGVLAPDPGHEWCKSGKWPCLLDPTSTAGTFLRYRDTNYLQAISPEDMNSERIRKALLGGLRYGKPMVIDMGEIDRFNMITSQVNNVQPGLMDKILDKRILNVEEFTPLVKQEDGEDYQPSRFTGGMADQFVFIVLMNGDVPPPDAGTKMFYILVQ